MNDKLDILPFSKWNPAGNKLLLIAGPCSAESEKQIVTTAAQLVKYHINIFRAGIWKPRSKPYSFSGCGICGFPWLNIVKKEFKLPIAIEIMSAEELNIALDNNIDYIWLGTRTTINPYMMDEIAKAIQGTDIPVFIKNPISPDINAWIGAIERINNAGIKKIAVVHRGFQSMYASPFRNEPLWNIPVKLKCLYPDLPLICDPSHIAGDIKYIEQIISKALSLELSGLMVEVHNNPAKALSDSKQQLTPTQFGEILEKVKFYNRSCSPTINNAKENEIALQQINTYRQLIDSYDENIIKTLAQRFDTVKKIGKIKQNLNMSALQSSRWNEIMKQCINLGKQLDLPEGFVSDLMELIHKQSLDIQ